MAILYRPAKLRDSNSNRPSDSIRKWLVDSKIIESAVPAPLLVVSLVKWLKPLTALSELVLQSR